MRKISNPFKKIECAKICFAEISKCAKRIEKAMAKCGVELCGNYDDPASVIICGVIEYAFPENKKASSYKPTKYQVKDLANDFQKIYTSKKK